MKGVDKFNQSQQMIHKYFEIFHYTNTRCPEVLPHNHDFYEIYISLSSDIDYIVEGVLYNLQPKDILLICPFQQHCPVVNEDCKDYNRIVIWLSKEFMSDLAKIDENIDFSFKICVERKNNLVRLYNTTMQSLYAGILLLLDEVNSENLGKSLACYSSMANLLVHLNRSVYFQGPFEMPNQSQNLIDDVMKYIMNNAATDLTLKKIASEFHISFYHLAHIFKERMGVSVYSYVIQRRMIIAKNSILSNVPITKVQELSGFKDYAGFYRVFKKEFGLSPKDFKKMHCK